MVTFEAIDLPGLTEAERAFRVATGELIVVSFTRRNAPEGWLAFNVDARQVNEDGTTAVFDGVPVAVPTKTVSVPAAALASGVVSIDHVRATATSEAVQQVVNYIAALKAWAKVPAANA